MYTALVYMFIEWHKPHNRLVEAKFYLIGNGKETKYIEEYLQAPTKNMRECFLIGWSESETDTEKTPIDGRELKYEEIIRMKSALEYMGSRKNTELKRYKHI